MSAFALPIVVGILVAWLITWLLNRRDKKRAQHGDQEGNVKNPKSFHESFFSLFLAGYIGFLAYTVLSEPWLPRALIELQGNEQIVGSMVGPQGEMTLILGSFQYETQWVKTADIESRQLCSVGSKWYNSTLRSLIIKTGTDRSKVLEDTYNQSPM